jgi:hypothetical protein
MDAQLQTIYQSILDGQHRDISAQVKSFAERCIP